MNNIYITGLPIGNLNDITLRALNTLKEVDFIYSEKPLKTLKLLNHFEIQKSVFIFSQNPSPNLINQFLEKLKKGSIAIVVEAGTPGISDPGNKLIHDLLESNPDLNIIPIPGVSALTTSLSVTGLNTQEFIFLGF
jgi:16S rRNA (cytidine1402-2'-O)-methyltransferase